MDVVLSRAELRWFTVLSKVLGRDTKKDRCFCMVRHWIPAMDKDDSKEDEDSCPEDILAKYHHHHALRQHIGTSAHSAGPVQERTSPT